MTAAALPVRFGQASDVLVDAWRPLAALLRARRGARLAALVSLALLPACATTSMPSVGQAETEGISGYVA